MTTPTSPTEARDSVLRRFFEFGAKIAEPIIPRTRAGDRLFAYVHFVLQHKRLPSDAPLFNDVLYRIKTTNEILDPLRVFVSDKEFAKIYVKAVAGDRYNVPTIDIIRSKSAVDGYDFPADCCIKPTHASKRVILRRNNASLDTSVIKSWFDLNYYRVGREANYKPLKPKVIVEPLIFENANVEDFKVFCLNGVPKLIQVDIDRHSDHRRKYFDTAWNELDFSIIYPRSETPFERPHNLDEMLDVASKISAGFSFVRVDLYSDGNEMLVGEITNCSESASGSFSPKAAEAAISRLVFSDWAMATYDRASVARSHSPDG